MFTRPELICEDLKRNSAVASVMIVTFIMLLSIGCAPSTHSYRLLSDEVISTVKSPPYSREQVKKAQESLRWRLSSQLRETSNQTELKNFACLMVAQQLDPTTARGERARSEVPCTQDQGKRCAHRCKRYRLPKTITLPPEYDSIAKRHDDILWSDLELISQRERSPQWEGYIEDCLDCVHAIQAKHKICQRDMQGLILTDERIPHEPLDRWLHQCETSTQPDIVALLTYRKWMLTPPEDLPYPLKVDHLPVDLQSSLTSRAELGEGIRLSRGPLDVPKITSLLSTLSAVTEESELWAPIKDRLQSRIDAPLMPCLEHGLEACITPAQIAQSRIQAAQYLDRCQLCEHREAVAQWYAHLQLNIEPLWRSSPAKKTTVLLRHAHPSSLIIQEENQLSRLNVEAEGERVTWSLQVDENRRPSHEAREPREDRLWPPTPRLSHHRGPQPPWVLISTDRALTAVSPEDGVVRWTYRFPFKKGGQLLPCLMVYPLPPDQLEGDLHEGGALCDQGDALLFLSAQGEPTARLICDATLGCGELLALTAQQTEASTQAKLTLMMAHSIHVETSSGEDEVRLTRYDLTQLDGENRVIQAMKTEEESTRWRSLKPINLKLSEREQTYLLALEDRGGMVSMSLLHPDTLQSVWRVQLGRDAPLYLPSVSEQENGEALIGVLNRSSFQLYSLNTGEPRFRLSIPQQRYDRREESDTSKHPLNWSLSQRGFTILHGLHRGIYLGSQDAKRVQKTLSFDTLDAASSLRRLDGQWVVTSPRTGQVIGIHPDFKRITWRWALPVFQSIELGSRWALVQFDQALQLLSVIPQNSDLPEKKQSLDEMSACRLGDRWDCLDQGDAVIELTKNQDLSARRAPLLHWFDKQQSTRSPPSSVRRDVAPLSQEGTISPVSLTTAATPQRTEALSAELALTAQWVWSASCQWGIAEACTRLGLLAELGLYSERAGELSLGWPLYTQSVEYYHRGAKLGDPLSHQRLAQLAEEGQGLTQDYQLARSSYATACEAGLSRSCARWGLLNELGLGGASRLAAAQSGYQKACDAGDQWACDRLEQSLH